jgi:23S rRNA (cytidine1920-2'-O)/16S rRNA (cytidine1409-2'-O)-methyltransferase
MAGAVLVGGGPDDPSGGRPVDKPGTRVPAQAEVRLRTSDHPYVSRGGLKLAAALDAFSIDPRGCVALDVGASTGGFTDCLLQRHARQVIAVDVGYGQFAWALRNDPRVVLFERQNLRDLRADVLPAVPDLVTVDVSFISLRIIIEHILTLCQPGAVVLPLVKPQFEVGKGRVGKGGVVRDPELRKAATAGVTQAARDLGYQVLGEVESPVPGPKGNRETFLSLRAPGR